MEALEILNRGNWPPYNVQCGLRWERLEFVQHPRQGGWGGFIKVGGMRLRKSLRNWTVRRTRLLEGSQRKWPQVHQVLKGKKVKAEKNVILCIDL